MQAKGRIGVIMPHVVPPMDNELISGISETVSACGYDTVLITGMLNFLSGNAGDSYAIGLENIYNLCEYADFDGIIFAAGRFLHTAVRDKILDMLRRRSMPVIVLEHKCDDFECIFPEQRKFIRLLTEHLIHEHGCRKLYCITGIKGEVSSEERLSGFCDAMDGAQLEYDEKCLFYGNYWHEIPCRIADDIASGALEMPDGIVCTNDEMATALCSRLISNGIKVPDQIAVTGYDGNFNSFFNDPPVTTVAGRDYQLGSTSAQRMLEMLGNGDIKPSGTYQKIRIGTSCGCGVSSVLNSSNDNRYLMNTIRRNNKMYAERRYYITADMISKITSCNSLNELMMVSSSLAYLLPNWNTLELCMCSDWSFDFEAPDSFRTEGYSDTMLQMLYQKKCFDTYASGEFSISRLLPSFDLPHEPMIYVISSVHHKQQIFGYLGTSYSSADDFLLDEYYVNWCDCVANGINSIQNKMYKAYVKQHFASLLTVDTSTGLYNKRGLMENVPDFLGECAQNNKSCAAVALSYESSREHYEVSPLFAIANILRRDNKKEVLLSRPDDKTILCLIASDSANEQDVIDSFNSVISHSLTETYGNALHVAMDDIALCCGFINGRHLEETEKEIEKLIARAADKAKVLAVNSGNCYIQLQNARRKILEAPQLDWNVDDIAKESGISKSYFQRLYRETFNTSCMDDIINARIERAKRLLENTDRQIGDIAIECGYASGSHFMRQFRQKTGLTASEYRKKNSGK